jgi:hypothetical protein
MMPDHGTTRWSGAIAVVVVRLSGPRGEVVHRSVVGLHVPLAVPRLSARAAVRAFAENTILCWRPRIIAAAREAVMPAFLDDETDWRRRSAIAAAASARTANRHEARRPAQSPLFGNYAAASRAARPGRAPERPHDNGDPRHVGDLDDIGSDPVALQPDIDLVVVLLRAGPGQHPGPEPAVQEDRA